jgi:hypothetical protein
MKYKLLPAMICLALAFSSQAQLQFGVGFTNTRGMEFGANSSTGVSAWHGMGLELMTEYRFKPRKSGILLMQEGIRFDIQSQTRYVRDNARDQSIGMVRLPLMYTNHIPLFLTSDKKPIFEFNSGVGYYVAKNLLHEGLPVGLSEEPKYWNHGLMFDLGITFYNQTGSRMYLKFNQALDLGYFNDASLDSPRSFLERGFVVGFSSSLPDTRVRWAMQNEAFRKRRSERKARKSTRG